MSIQSHPPHNATAGKAHNSCRGPSTDPHGLGTVNLTPPRGSHVEVRAKGSSLEVEIGGTGFLGRGTRTETGFWVLWTGHLGFVTTRLTLDGIREGLAFGMFVVPFWLISGYIGIRALFGMYGSTKIQVDERAVVVERRLFGWRRVVNAAVLDWAGARVAYARSDRPAWTHCELAFGVDTIKTAQRLSRAEQEWLSEMLNGWIGRLRSGA